MAEQTDQANLTLTTHKISLKSIFFFVDKAASRRREASMFISEAKEDNLYVCMCHHKLPACCCLPHSEFPVATLWMWSRHFTFCWWLSLWAKAKMLGYHFLHQVSQHLFCRSCSPRMRSNSQNSLAKKKWERLTKTVTWNRTVNLTANLAHRMEERVVLQDCCYWLRFS